MIDLDLAALRSAAGIGVAGNFAGHLEQAGEAADFVGVVAEPEAPKGIFPWHLPGDPGFLGTFPLGHDRLALPAPVDGPVDLQIEPEVGVLCAVEYDRAGRVSRLVPRAIGAFDDCSIRRAGAPKISFKKNWGADSKGVARRLFPVDDLDPAGATRTMRLASFLRRDGEVGAYGVDSPLVGYSYYGARLLDWIAERLREQRGGEGTPLEDVGAALRASGAPATALVGIGATRYTSLGESTYLREGDAAIVIVYDAARIAPEGVAEAVAAGHEDGLRDASVLRQVVAPAG